MARTINSIEKHNSFVTKTQIQVVMTFRTQQLYDLWINEMQGQISDGMWENSRRTDWLWKNVWCQLGDETKVEVGSSWIIGKKSFGMTGELWNIIGDRIMDENGFETEKEAKKAWREIATAIYNAKLSKTVVELCQGFVEEQKKKVQNQWPELRQEWLDAGVVEEIHRWGNTYSTYVDETNKKGYINISSEVNKDGVLGTIISHDGRKYRVAKGNLKEALEALRTFVVKMETLR